MILVVCVCLVLFGLISETECKSKKTKTKTKTKSTTTSNTDFGSIKSIENEKDLRKAVKGVPSILIGFGASKSSKERTDELLSLLDQVSRSAKGHSSIGFVDCDVGKSSRLCKAESVGGKNKGRPFEIRLKHYLNGEFSSYYDRSLNSKSLEYFLKNPRRPPPWSDDPYASSVLHLTSDQHLMDILKKESAVLVLWYQPWIRECPAVAMPAFASAASEYRSKRTRKADSLIFAAGDASLELRGSAQALNVTIFPTLKYFYRGGYQFDFYNYSSPEALLEFAVTNAEERTPPPAPSKWEDDPDTSVEHLTSETFGRYVDGKGDVMVMFHSPLHCPTCSSVIPEFEAAASSSNSGSFAAVDVQSHPIFLRSFSIESYPTVLFFHTLDDFFRYEGDLTTQDFLDFLETPVPPPPSDISWEDEAPYETSKVKHLDVASFSDVLHQWKHAIVMFYAPWCGHCKTLKPEYVNAAQTVFLEQPDALFAAVDCIPSREICGQHSIKGFPTLKYFTNGEVQEDVVIQGRTAEELVSFIREQTQNDNVKDEL